MDAPSGSTTTPAPGAPITLEAPEGRYDQVSWITPGSGASIAATLANAASPSAGTASTTAGGAAASSSAGSGGAGASGTDATTPSTAAGGNAASATSTAAGGTTSTPSGTTAVTPVAPASQIVVSMGALPTITSQSGVPVTTFSPVTPSARLSVAAVRYPRRADKDKDKERERERETGTASGGSEANTGSADGSTSGTGEGAGEGKGGPSTSGGPILESTLAAQGIDAPATHMTGGAGGLSSLASSWAWEGGLGSSTPGSILGSNAASQFGAPQAANAKPGKASRPKNSLKQTSSSFVHRVSVHPELAKILAARDERDLFSFVNTGKSLMWLADTEGKVKECLARIMFGSHVTAHDVNQSNRSFDRLDLIVGFASGDVVWLDPMSMRYSRINKGGCITDSGVTQIRWMPGSESIFLTSHLDGSMLLWDKDREDPSAGAFIPTDVTSLPAIHRGSDPNQAAIAAAVAAAASRRGANETMEVLASDGSADSSLYPRLSGAAAAADVVRSRTGSTATTSSNDGGGASASSTDVASGAPLDGSLQFSAWDPRRFLVVTHPGEQIGVGGVSAGGVGAATGLGAGQTATTTTSSAGLKKKETVVWARTNPVSHWKVSRSKINDFAFSPDFPHVAVVAEDGLLRIIDIPAERLEQTFTSYFGALNCLAFSPDGRFLLTGGCDDLVTVWAPREGRIVARCPGHSSFVTALAFDPWRWRSDDTRTYRFASVGEDCKLILWDFSSAALQRPKTHVASSSAAAARRSSMGSTHSLGTTHGVLASSQQQDPRRTSLSGARAGSIGLDRSLPATTGGVGGGGVMHEAVVHSAPPRREVAQLQPVLVQQLCPNPATMSDLLVGVRFRPDGIVVLHRSGNVQTFRRPRSTGSAVIRTVEAQREQKEEEDGRRAKNGGGGGGAAAGSGGGGGGGGGGKRRLPGLGMGIGRSPSSQGVPA